MRIAFLLTFLIATCLVTAREEAEDVDFELEEYEISTEAWSDIYPDMNLDDIGNDGGDDWIRFAVRFVLQDDEADDDDYTWISQLACNWNIVLAQGRNGLRNPDVEYSVRFRRTIHYVHVRVSEDGEEYWAMIWLPPEIMERYGDDGDLLPDDYIMGRLDLTHGHRHIGTVWFRGDDATEGESPRSRVLGGFVSSEEPEEIPNTLFHRLETPWSYSGSDADNLMRLHPGAAISD